MSISINETRKMVDRVRELVLDPQEPTTAMDVIKANNDLLTFLLSAFQVQADKFTSGCTIKLNYEYNEELEVAKLRTIIAEGEYQIKHPIQLLNLESCNGTNQD